MRKSNIWTEPSKMSDRENTEGMSCRELGEKRQGLKHPSGQDMSFQDVLAGTDGPSTATNTGPSIKI